MRFWHPFSTEKSAPSACGLPTSLPCAHRPWLLLPHSHLGLLLMAATGLLSAAWGQSLPPSVSDASRRVEGVVPRAPLSTLHQELMQNESAAESYDAYAPSTPGDRDIGEQLLLRRREGAPSTPSWCRRMPSPTGPTTPPTCLQGPKVTPSGAGAPPPTGIRTSPRNGLPISACRRTGFAMTLLKH